ncbi:MAG: hypothetical protein ACI9M1_001664 [Porticoccaceae bacterium]|jgi:hypothetical protein
MKNSILLPFVLSLFSNDVFSQSSKTPIDTKVSELLSKMSVEQKIGQITQNTVTNFKEKGNAGLFLYLTKNYTYDHYFFYPRNKPQELTSTISNVRNYD